MNMKICFFGVGGVGGYFGALVTKKFADQHDIYFIARGTHKKAIDENGLTLKKEGGEDVINVTPKVCTNTIEDLPVCDVIILSVKEYDLSHAVIQINKIVNKNTIVLPLLNGVDVYERIRKHLDKGIVLPSCVYVGTHIESPGVIYQKGGSCKIFIGADPLFPEYHPEALLNLFKDSEINFSWEDNVKVSIWSKYMFIAAYGLVTAAYNKTIGEVLTDAKLAQITLSIMREIQTITKALNIPLAADIVDTSFNKAKQFPFETKTSFQRDFESKGNINERDLFGGTLIRFSEELNIPTPNTKSVYERLFKEIN